MRDEDLLFKKNKNENIKTNNFFENEYNLNKDNNFNILFEKGKKKIHIKLFFKR
jgi:hypothetical protein